MNQKTRIRSAVCIAAYVAAVLFGLRAAGTAVLYWIGQQGGVWNTGSAAYAAGTTATAGDIALSALPCLLMLAIAVYCTWVILQEKKVRNKKQ